MVRLLRYFDDLVNSQVVTIEIWRSWLCGRVAYCAKGSTQRARIGRGMGQIYEVIGQCLISLITSFPNN